MLLTSFTNLPDTNYYPLLNSHRIPKEKNDYTGSNIFNWFSKHANDSLFYYQKSFTVKKKKAAFIEVNQAFLEGLPFTPLFYHPRVVALPKSILNFPFNIDDKLEYQISQQWLLKAKKSIFKKAKQDLSHMTATFLLN